MKKILKDAWNFYFHVYLTNVNWWIINIIIVIVLMGIRK